LFVHFLTAYNVSNSCTIVHVNYIIIININQLKVSLVWPLALPGNFSNANLLFLGLVGLSVTKPILGDPYREDSAGGGKWKPLYIGSMM